MGQGLSLSAAALPRGRLCQEPFARDGQRRWPAPERWSVLNVSAHTSFDARQCNLPRRVSFHGQLSVQTFDVSEN